MCNDTIKNNKHYLTKMNRPYIGISSDSLKGLELVSSLPDEDKNGLKMFAISCKLLCYGKPRHTEFNHSNNLTFIQTEHINFSSRGDSLIMAIFTEISDGTGFTNPRDPRLKKPLGGSKVDSAFHSSDVAQISTEMFWGLRGKM